MRIIISILLFLLSYNIEAQRIRVKTGIEVLKEDHYEILEGKRVGLITNPTGVDNFMKSTIDILYEAPNVNLVALYSPEHGVRGNMYAGDKVSDSMDKKTGLPIYSLYGKNRKPTSAMLKDIDILVYDIQDNGCRSFTFISTMGLAMEACAENDKEFVVLDRPNPLGGKKIEGCLVENDCKSFVSEFKIPYIYGLTCGELAMMLNGEHMLKAGKQCKLQVVKMKYWKREMNFEDTGLQWIAPSPHIPQAVTSFFYPMSGILGELNYMNIGVGYTLPFQIFAASWVKADELTKAMNALNIPGIIFRPIYIKPFYAFGEGNQLQGVQVHILNYSKAPLTDIQFLIMQEIALLYPDKAAFKFAPRKNFRIFDMVCGSKQIRNRFQARYRWEDVKPYWYKDVEAFRKLSKKYYLYKNKLWNYYTREEI